MKRRALVIAAWTLATVPVFAGNTCNSPPVAVPDSVRAGFSGTHLFDPLHNDVDVDGDALSLQSIANPSAACSGSITPIGGGLVRYTPTGTPLPGGASFCTVSYTVADGHTSRHGLITLTLPSTVIFADGFETGNLSAWSDSLGSFQIEETE